MPLYDFKCNNCLQTTERLTKVGTEVVACPHCQSTAYKQLSSPGAFDLRGSGWYKPSAKSDE